MKIGIITLLGNNYGNRLQNYAVQEILSNYGDVYTIRYEKKQPKVSANKSLRRFAPSHIINAINSRLLNVYHISSRTKTTLDRVLYFVKNRNLIKSAITRRNLSFLRYDNRYIKYESELLHMTGDDDADWVRTYDAWVCGSDQIWNPNYPTATRNAFLQFVPYDKRISLSASIGLSNIDDIPTEYKEWINGIKYLSVREQKAAEIIKHLTNRVSEVLLDPTMLLPIEKWNDMADGAECDLPDKYAVGYFLGIREKKYLRYINSQLKKYELSYIDLLNGEEPQYLDYSPDQMIAAIRNAKIVFVDSFHGVVFSILFHKQFVVFPRIEDGKSMNSRLETLLDRFSMRDRVFDPNSLDRLDKTIDYSKADRIIEEEKTKIKAFLDSAMQEISLFQNAMVSEKKSVNIYRSERCTGCTACSNICPKKCITMESDEEGFVYPSIDFTSCINCGSCSAVCPVLHNNGGNAPREVLAEKNKNEAIRSTSSSGGVFYELASQCIINGGYVVGCALDENMVARHIIVKDKKALEQLKSSKYVQSDMSDIFSQVKKLLDNGDKVLFSGTPCQCAGLRNYLRKSYDNLFMVDILCHGVPSPKLFADYLEYLSHQYGDARPVSVNFRNKQRGWKRLYMEVKFDNGKRHYTYSGYDRYESMFLNNMSLRPSCYECKFTKPERYGDITLGDFWGIGKQYPEWDDDKGISLVMINTDLGQKLWDSVKAQFSGRAESFDLAKAGQRTLYAPTQKNDHRDDFYKMCISNGTEAALENYTNVPSIVVRAYYAVMRKGLDLVRKVLRKGY